VMADIAASDSVRIEANPAAGASYSERDAAGAPKPLAPELVTMSMLPRTQWLSLVHLDTIKTRNKPIEAPKKPKAAPFFLPTLAGANAGRNPVFDIGAADDATAAAAAAAWGGGEEDDQGLSASEGDSEGEAGDANGAVQVGGGSRVVRGGASNAAVKSQTLALLRKCSDAGDWTSLVAHLRQLSPSEVDRELRGMQLLEESSPEQERDVALLFTFLEQAAASNANFEFVQALLKAAVAVHGDAIATRPAVQEAAVRVKARLSATWRRLNGTLQHVRCMVGLLGSLQA